jgi:glycosyltransferase involved in cell wall biosynthesis
VDISVIVCTRDRAESLAETLDSLAAQVLPQSVAWEVLVVDNASGDRTGAVAQEFANRHPGRFRYVHEARPGKSFALNAGVEASRGEILAFTDDDVNADPAWLQRLTDRLASGDWSGAGGRVAPAWDGAPPRWLPNQGEYPLAPLALFDLGSEPGELTESPYGVNMAYRRAVFERHGGFRTDLGPRPGSDGPQKNEDTEFGRRLLGAGERFCYEPAAVVYHRVASNRLRKGYFLAWWLDKARSDVHEAGRRDTASFRGVPWHLLRRLVGSTLQWTLSLGARKRFYRKTQVWYLLGQILESHRQAASESRAVEQRERARV